MWQELTTIIGEFVRDYNYWKLIREEGKPKDYQHIAKSKKEWTAYCTGRITTYEHVLTLLSKLQGE